jgi:hypothetical protein
VDLLKGVGPNDHRLHRRRSKPPLGRYLGAFERRSKRRVRAGERDIHESLDACVLGGINEGRHADLVDLVDGGTAGTGKAASDN